MSTGFSLDFSNAEKIGQGPISHTQRAKFFALINELKRFDSFYSCNYIDIVNKYYFVSSTKELTWSQMATILDCLEKEKEKYCQKQTKKLTQIKETNKLINSSVSTELKTKQTELNLNELTGKIISIRFKSDDNFYIFSILTENNENISIKGNCSQELSINTKVKILGNYVTHLKYGKQFQASYIDFYDENQELTNIKGLERFLTTLPGIGKGKAEKIINKFGEKTLNIINNEPEKLLEIKGITESILQQLLIAYEQTKTKQKILIWLLGLDISSSQAGKILDVYGDETIETLKENPYIIIDTIKGIGFKKADAIALSLGIAKNAEIRIIAGINHIFDEKLTINGNTAYQRFEIVNNVRNLLESVNLKEIDEIISNEIELGNIILEDNLITSKTLYNYEKNIAKKLFEIKNAENKLKYEFNPVEFVENKFNITLSNSQSLALQGIMSNNLSIITGGPGTGKTTLVRSILNCLNEISASFSLAAPTGKAAKRLAQSTDNFARTIHRLMAYRSAYIHYDFIIIDEFSMVDTKLFHELLCSLDTKKQKLILVGDMDQLPSIGPGKLLSDLIESNEIPTFKLIEIQRQAIDSDIIKIAHQINVDHIPNFNNHNKNDFRFLEVEESTDIIRIIKQLIINDFSKYNPIWDIQVLSPMNKNDLGVANLNNELKSLLNKSEISLEYGNKIFNTGDKVIQTTNNYELKVMNGEVGIIDSINTSKKKLIVDYSGYYVEYTVNEMGELQLAYCTTIHKSQGSEYPVVIIPIHKSHSYMNCKKLLYTAITRGKEFVVLVGSRASFVKAMFNTRNENRITLLPNRIKECVEYYVPLKPEDLINVDEIPF